MNEMPANPTGQTGRVLIIVAFVITIALDIIVDLVWFFKFGFSPGKLVSVLVTVLLFHYTYNGAPAARWLMVAFSAFALIMIGATGFSLHPLMILIMVSTLACLIMLSLPQVGVYQQLKKEALTEPPPTPETKPDGI